MRDTLRQRDDLLYLGLRAIFLQTARGSRLTDLDSPEGDARQDVSSTLSQDVAFAKKESFEKACIDLFGAFATKHRRFPCGRRIIVVVEEGLCMFS